MISMQSISLKYSVSAFEQVKYTCSEKSRAKCNVSGRPGRTEEQLKTTHLVFVH